jgi:hypothetical protein
MKTILRKAVSAAIAGSMALTAVPAFARSGDAHVGLSLRAGNDRVITVDSHSHADVRLNNSGRTLRVEKVDHGRDDDHDEGHSDDRNKTKTQTGSLVTRMEGKINTQLSLTARIAAAFSKKICVWLGSSDGTALSTCMRTRRDAILAYFTTQLNLAFGI